MAKEENQEAASESSPVDHRQFWISKTSHPQHPRQNQADRAAQILMQISILIQISNESGDIQYGHRRQDRKNG
jgi:hypothetical protein